MTLSSTALFLLLSASGLLLQVSGQAANCSSFCQASGSAVTCTFNASQVQSVSAASCNANASLPSCSSGVAVFTFPTLCLPAGFGIFDAHLEITPSANASSGTQLLINAEQGTGAPVLQSYQQQDSTALLANAVDWPISSSNSSATQPLVSPDVASLLLNFNSSAPLAATFFITGANDTAVALFGSSSASNSSSSLRGAQNATSPKAVLVVNLAPSQVAMLKADLDTLNYALSLEYIESAFYADALASFPNDSWFQPLSAGNSSNFNATVIHERFREIGAHEQSHVADLTSAITSLCAANKAAFADFPQFTCAPTPLCAYSFPLSNATAVQQAIGTFAQLSSALENTGVSAYDGALGGINSPQLATGGATIATVEARHAAFVNSIQGLDPFPNAFDITATRRQVLCIAEGFIANKTACAPFAALGRCS